MAQTLCPMCFQRRAALPWIGTPAQLAYNRLLTPVFDALGVRQNVISVVDQESSMLAMVRSGVGLILCRASVELGERQEWCLSA